MASWWIDYTLDFGAGTVAVRVDPSGPSLVLLTGNLGSKQEIGTYRSPLPADRCAKTRTTMQATNYQNLPSPPFFAPESQSLAFGEGSSDIPTAYKAFALDELPADLKPFMDVMELVVAEVRQKPHRVLSGAAQWELTPLPQGEDLRGTLTLENKGIVPLEIHHPAGAGQDDEVGLQLLVTKDKPNEELEEGDLFETWLKRGQIRLVPPPGQLVPRKPRPTVELLPDDKIQIQFRSALRLSPGKYKAVITLHSIAGDIDPQRVVEGTLAMDLGLFVVAKRSTK